ncbi:GLPGLI family protein [Flavobacterium sp.]|uniref:GLPGLI family protein n=1 Tax=Flavobacterium sp. TaxID=239 RepID=UPI0038FCAA81
MKSIILLLTALFFSTSSIAQQFIDQAEIEFEVNTNLKKTMSNNSWDEKMKDNLSELKTSYYTYTFAENKSIYKFARWSEKTRIPKYEKDEDEENIWYFDFDTKTMSVQKQIANTNFVISDSIANIEWKITNENREIAGYNCRKAVGKILDDVYVFAFYTDDITISGGPCSVNGLPGMILGLTIPRLYTSFIATKVNLKVNNTVEIKPISSKKTYHSNELKMLLTEKTKDWFGYGVDEDEKKRQKNIFLWNAFL